MKGQRSLLVGKPLHGERDVVVDRQRLNLWRWDRELPADGEGRFPRAAGQSLLDCRIWRLFLLRLQGGLPVLRFGDRVRGEKKEGKNAVCENEKAACAEQGLLHRNLWVRVREGT